MNMVAKNYIAMIAFKYVDACSFEWRSCALSLSWRFSVFIVSMRHVILSHHSDQLTDLMRQRAADD
jgi:hypothetical protein